MAVVKLVAFFSYLQNTSCNSDLKEFCQSFEELVEAESAVS